MSAANPDRQRSTPPSGNPRRNFGYPDSWVRPTSRRADPGVNLAELGNILSAVSDDATGELRRALTSRAECDQSGDAPANIVDALFSIGRALRAVAVAIEDRSLRHEADPTKPTSSHDDRLTPLWPTQRD